MTHQEKGFTLIELLIVILIISIVASVAVLSIRPNTHKQIESTAHQIVNLFNLVETEALLRGVTLGVKVTPDRLKFYEWDEKQKPPWRFIQQGALKPFLLPAKSYIRLKKEETENKDKKLVDMIFTASGDVTPFILQLGVAKKSPIYQIRGQQNGSLSSEPINEK